MERTLKYYSVEIEGCSAFFSAMESEQKKTKSSREYPIIPEGDFGHAS